MKLRNLLFAALGLFALAACTETPEPPYNPGGNPGGNGGTTEEGVYINETFKSDFGVFSTEETVGNYPWVIDYSTAKATSYVDGENKAATSWLISSPVDFTNETEAYVAFDYIIRYAENGKVAANHQLLISNNYAGNAAEATWVDLPYNAVEGSDWATFYKANVAVPAEFLGKSGVVFALRYTATTKAGTWEVKNFKVAHGKAEIVEPEEAKEYTVAEALAAFGGAAKPAVVKGYIVGTINGQVYAEGCVFSGTAESKTNLLIADNPDETDYNNCMPVQLPSGAVRNALNLVDNPGNYKKMVTLTGSLEKYFGVAGLKSVTKYVIDGVTPEEPETPETPEGTYISESFATSFGSFTTQETVGNYPWIIDYSTAKMTSYTDTDGDGKADTDHEATSWLVSPTVDFTNETEAYVAFEYIIRYAESGKVAENHQLLISDNYSGDVATASWTNLPYNAVEGADWNTFYKASVNVPAEFLGKANITFALRYTATTKAGTWEVKNLIVAHGKAETTETPETPDTPSETGEYTVTEALSAFVAGEAKPATVKGYIVGSIDDKSISDANFSGAAVLKTNLLIADNADETDITKCLAVQLPSGAVRDALNLVENPGNYKKYVTLTGSLEKYFGVAGLKAVTAYTIDGTTPETPETPEPEEPETPDTPDTPSIPTEGNILENGSFEEWNGNVPTAWGKDDSNASAHSATISQSTEANDGGYAVVVNGDAKGNKRLASKCYTLPAGTYSYTIYVKTNGSDAGHCRLGYVPIADGKAGSYVYEEAAASAVTGNWTARTLEFTLAEESTVALVVMNNKTGNGASFLVDNATLVKK